MSCVYVCAELIKCSITRGLSFHVGIELIHYFLNAGCLGKLQEMNSENTDSITRVLFCGPHFAASQNYTREYLQSAPFIKVLRILRYAYNLKGRLVQIVQNENGNDNHYIMNYNENGCFIVDGLLYL